MSGDPYAGIAVPEAAFTDTGLPGTSAQVAFYRGLAHGTNDYASKPKGSAENPYALRPGDQPPAGAFYVDMDGRMHPPGDASGKPPLEPAQGHDDPYASIAVHADSLPVDLAKSGETGVRRGVAATMGGGGDLVNWLAPNGGGGHMLLGAAQDLTGSDLGQPYWGGDKNLPIRGEGVDIRHGRGEDLPPDQVNWAHRLGLFTSADGNDALQQIAPYHKPQTAAGRYVESVGEYAIPAALGGKNLLQRSLGAVVPGALSQFGEDATHSPYGRLAGGILGLGGAHVIGSAIRSPEQLVADATAAVSPEQQRLAIELMRDGAERGVHVTFPEAVQQVTGGATGAGRLQRVVESTKEGEAQLAPMFAQRPDQVRSAVLAHADALAPPSTAPSLLAADTRDAATNVLRNAEAERSAAVKPFYEAADPQTVPAEDAAQVLAYLDERAATDKTGLLAAPLRQLRDMLTDKEATQKAKEAYDAALAARAGAKASAPNPDAAGLEQANADLRTYRAGQTGSLFSAIRAKGGVKLRGANGSSIAGPDVAPYLDGKRMPGLVNNAGGLPGERMAQSLADDGWFGPDPGDPFDAFTKAFEREARGNKVFHPETYAPDYKERREHLDREISDAGVTAADSPKDQARKLWDWRNADALEREAVQGEGNLNDPHAAEFDRLSAPPQDPGRVPITDIANLDRVRKAVRDRIELGFAPIGREPLVKEQSAALGEALQRLDALMERESPEFAHGKRTFADFTGAVNRPLETGPLGRISNGAGAADALYPNAPPEGTPSETAIAIRLLGGEDPRLPGAVTRQHVVNTFNEAAQDNMGGPNQWGGAKYAARLLGNPEQRATLEAGYQGLPQGGERLEDLQRLIRVLEAHGKRLGVGSNTAEKLGGLSSMKTSSVGKAIEDFNITKPLSILGRASDAVAYRARVNSLVRMLQAGPDEIDQLMAGVNRGRTYNQGTLAQLLLQAPEAHAGQ